MEMTDRLQQVNDICDNKQSIVCKEDAILLPKDGDKFVVQIGEGIYKTRPKSMGRTILQPLGTNYFRKIVLYSLDMGVSLEKFKIASGSYNCPVAFFQPQSSTSDGKSSPAFLQIMMASGQIISETIWPNGSVSSMGWTNEEDLLFVQENGYVFVYKCLGPLFAKRHALKEKFSMGKEAENLGVLSSCTFGTRQGTGVAAITGNYRIYCVNNHKDGTRLFRMPEIHGMNSSPNCWTVYMSTEETIAIVALGSELTAVSKNGDVRSLDLQRDKSVDAYVSIKVSNDLERLAAYSQNGVVWIGSIDGSKRFREFDTQNGKRQLQQMVWCTNDAVILSWQDAGGHTVMLLGVCDDSDPIEYYYDDAVQIFPEVDGVRILSPNGHEFIQRVPPVLCDLLLFSSVTHPGSNLFTAATHLDKGNPEAHEYLNTVRDHMDIAVKQCLEAAIHSWDVDLQKRLIRAAGVGKSFLFNYKRDSFHEKTRILRVLNTLRLREIGIPLSYVQYERITIQYIIKRLIIFGHYPLVERICEFLDIPDSEGFNMMLDHWASMKLSSKTDESTIANQIIDKFGGRPGIGYAEIASKAFDAGKQTLAERLLDCETRINKQVPLLLNMGLFESALSKAVKSGDTELIYMVLQHSKKELNNSEFLKIVQKSPVALALHVETCPSDSQFDIHELEDNFLAQARLCQKELFSSDQISVRDIQFQKIEEFYRKGQNEFGSKETHDAKMLAMRQRSIEDNFPQISLSNCSLHETLLRIGKAGQMKCFDSMRKEFNISEKRFWHLMIDIHASTGDWPAMEKLSKSKRSPVGYDPFFHACMQHSQLGEAEKYLNRMETEPRVRGLFKLGRLEEAIETAFQRRSDGAFRYLESHTFGTDRDKVMLEYRRFQAS